MAKMSVAEWVQEMNSFAKARNAEKESQRMAAGEQVRVLVKAVFNGPGHKGIGWHEVGEIISVAAGPYTDDLVRKGFVTRQLVPPEVVVQKPEPRVVVVEPEEVPDEKVELPNATAGAKRAADELGVDLAAVDGSGTDGRITKADVLRHNEELSE